MSAFAQKQTLEFCRASLAYLEKRCPQAENVPQSSKLKRNKCTKTDYATLMLCIGIYLAYISVN